MFTKERLDFLLKLTDSFHGHWEDPEWGRRPMNQVLVLLGSHILADGIADEAARQRVQSTIEKAMTDATQEIISSQDPVPPNRSN